MTTTPTTDGGVENNDHAEGDSLSVAEAKTYVAVGGLADAIGPESYNQRDVSEAVGHLREARARAPEGTDTAERIDTALGYLTGLERLELDKRRVKVRDALADLAPVAAGVADRERNTDERPTVPVFYNIPPEAADRAIAKFEERRKSGPVPGQKVTLREFIYNEIDESPVIFVGDAPLAEYASNAGVGGLVIDPNATDE